MPYISKLVSKKPQGMRDAAVLEAEMGPQRPSCWKLALGAGLLCYGIFDSYLFTKFTPVYRSTSCGDQVADLQDFSIGMDSISVGLKISLTCQNPNGYAVEVMSSTPGHVFAGADRAIDLGTVSLVKGSTLPANGDGTISVHMDSTVPSASTGSLVSRFLAAPVVPLFLDLQFDIAISMSFGVASFGTTAPFSKKCGLHMAGMLVNSAERLGPLICRSSFEEVEAALAESGSSSFEAMTFSAEQMDPDRIRMGEALKNVSIIGMAILCYGLGGYLVFTWMAQRAACAALLPCDEAQIVESQESRFGRFAAWVGVGTEAPPADVERPAAQGLLARAAGALGSLSPYGRVAADEESADAGSSPKGLWALVASPGSMSSRSTAATESSPAGGASRPGGLSPVLTLLTCKRGGKPRGDAPASPWLPAV